MKYLLTPKLDYVFKKLFTKDVKLLIDFINSVLLISDKQSIVHIEIKNPEILPEHIQEKYIILDIKARDDMGNQYDIEMQSSKYSFYPKRSAYYLAKLFANQLMSGENYSLLEPVIGIHFLDYIIYSNYPDYCFCFELRDKKYPELIYTNDLSLNIFELPKVVRKKQEQKLSEKEIKRFEWLDFLNHAHEGGEKMQRSYYTNPMIQNAFELLASISADKQTRMEAEFREVALRNKISELSAAMEEGIEKGMGKGLFRGIELGLDLKFGKSGLNLLSRIKDIKDINSLISIQEGIKSADSVEKLHKIITEVVQE